MTTPLQAPDIVVSVEHARWLQHTLADAATVIESRAEPRYLHHDLTYHAIWLQRRLQRAAAHPEPGKEPHP